jgi:Zn-dependent peptidase ImmA (M78 family)
MSQTFRLEMAKQKAAEILHNQRITTLPVDPFAIAASRDIIVKAKSDTAKGVSGMLLRHGDVFGILYATYVSNEGFQRFSVAHELGHYFLDGHIDHVLPKDGVHESHAGFVSADPYEMEADCFAASLLMPIAPFKRTTRRFDPGLALIESLSKDCRTSLTATAIRYAELTEDAVAVIISTGLTVDFCFLSEAMKSLPELSWPRKGSPVPKSTLTAWFNGNPERILKSDRSEGEIEVTDWLGGTKSILVWEEVVGLGRYGKTLTILSSSSIGQEEVDEDAEEDEESIIERWTPRFRR